jgi:hypothetical protein
MPKSRILQTPSRSTITFDGLRSRWTQPEACRYASPRSICTNARRMRAWRAGAVSARGSSMMAFDSLTWM